MSNEIENPHRRKTDESITSWLKDKVVAPLIVAFILASSAGGLAMYKKLDDLSVQMTQQYTQQQGRELEIRVAAAEREITVIKANMVTMDILKKLELGMSLVAASGKSDQAMKVLALTLRQEIDSRKEAK